MLCESEVKAAAQVTVNDSGPEPRFNTAQVT